MPDTNLPELLYLLVGDPAELATTAAGLRTADIAEALNELSPAAAARVLSTLPFDVAVQVLDEPELAARPEIFHALPDGPASALIEAMAADRQTYLFRELTEEERERLLAGLSDDTRRTLTELLRYPPD